MAEEEKKAVVIEILADASKFGATAKAAIEAAMKDMDALGTKAEATGGKTKEAFAGTASAVEHVGLLLKMTKALMDQYGESVLNAARLVAAHFESGKARQEEFYQGLVRSIAGTSELGEASQKAAQQAVAGFGSATQATDRWAGAMRIAKGLLAAMGFGSILQVLRSFVGLLKEAVDVAAEFSVAQLRLQIGIRAAQREFGLAAGTTEEWTGFIHDLRKQFQIFSLVDLTAATAKVILLTRELGFTKDQMMETTKAAIVLAEVSGRDVEDAARRLALFLDTGYARGLAQLGVQISKVSVEQYALSQGIKKTYNEMTRAERASLGLAAVMEQVNRLMDDAGTFAFTLKGQFMILKAAQSDTMIEIGNNSAFLFLTWERVKTYFITEVVPNIVDGLKGLALAFELYWTGIIGAVTLGFITLRRLYENAEGIISGDVKIGDVLAGALEESIDRTRGMFQQLHQSMFPAGEGLGNVAAEQMSMLESAVLDAGETTEEVGEKDFKKFVNDVRDALRDAAEAATEMKLSMERDFEDLSTKLERDFQDAFTDLLRDLEDVERDYNEKRAELIADAAQKEKESTREGVDRRAELMAEYRLREIQDQREFNIEMAQLEREYLLTLEDAVRERDARAVLMLMRKHNVEVLERNEDFAEKRRQAAENLQLDLAQIRQAEARKRQELRESLNKQLADLQRNFYLQSQEKYKNYLRELEDIRLRNEREREDLRLEYKRRETDLETHLRNRLTLIASKFADESNLTASFVGRIMGLLHQLAGAYASPLIQGMMTGIGGTLPSAPPLPGTMRGGTRVPSRSTATWPGAGHAEGGLAVARKPTPAIFGEGGPEAAMFMPLNRMKEFGGGFGAGGQSRIALDINVEASPDLVVSIVDRTMSEVAEVIMRASG